VKIRVIEFLAAKRACEDLLIFIKVQDAAAASAGITF
jgi:hypothetical protein